VIEPNYNIFASQAVVIRSKVSAPISKKQDKRAIEDWFSKQFEFRQEGHLSIS